MNALIVSNCLLWLLVIVLSLVVFALARQIGVLHERITPVGALMLRKGPAVGAPVPVTQVLDMDGRSITIGGASASGRSTLLAFVSPSCPVCKALLPVLKSSRGGERKWLDVILASDGDVEEHRRFVSAQGLQDFPYVLSTALGMSFEVSRLPFAAVLDAHGILRARGIINSREHLESLFEAERRGVASLQEFLEARQETRAA